MERQNQDLSAVKTKLQYLVIDAGAIIRGHGYTLPNVSNVICTVQEVLNEVRDSKSRHLLETLPYSLEIISPSDAAMKAVTQFSKKTGDFAALSLTDLKLIALVYTLEVQLNGEDHILEKMKVVYIN